MSQNNQLIAVTGSAGFIGAYVVQYLLERGYSVKAFVRDPTDEKKISYLRDLDKTENKSKIEFVGGDLETANYEEIFKGCYAVIHIASPYIHTAADPYNEIVRPAITGTVKVLEACSKINSIKRVIVTSSAGAVINSLNPNIEPLEVYDDDCWNTESTLENSPYFYSKVEAEKAAWKFVKENDNNPNSNHFELAVINPTFILGPSMSSNLNTSIKLVSRISFDASPMFPVRVGLVDVRDVAMAHVLVLEAKETNKRYLVGQSVHEFKYIPLRGKELLPNIKFNIIENLPVCKVKEWKINTNRIQSLGLKYIDFDQTLIDTFNQLSKFNLIPNQN